jgi:hypothetical protein
MTAAPFLLMGDWKEFLRWTDAAIQHLEQPSPFPNSSTSSGQHRRGNIAG